MEMNLSQYAKHRGVSLAAVQKALKTSRIKVSRAEVRGKMKLSFVESEAADRDWKNNTDQGQQRTATRGDSAAIKRRPTTTRRSKTRVSATVSAAGTADFDPPAIAAAIDNNQLLEAIIPDYIEQILRPVRVISKALVATPAGYRAFALAELVELQMNEFIALAAETD